MSKTNMADVRSHPSAALTPEMMLRDALREAGSYSAVVIVAMDAETGTADATWSNQSMERLSFMERTLNACVDRALLGDG